MLVGLPWSLSSKESACSVEDTGDVGLAAALGRSPGEGHGFLLQYSCLEKPMDRGAWWATVHGVARVGHDLVTKPPPPPYCIFSILLTLALLYHFTSVRMATIRNSTNSKCWRGCGEKPSYTVGGNVSWYNYGVSSEN